MSEHETGNVPKALAAELAPQAAPDPILTPGDIAHRQAIYENRFNEIVRMNRRTRRANGIRLKTAESADQCQAPGCENTVGIVSVGQEKRYCSKTCKKNARHRA